MAEAWEDYLDPGERLLWTGAPATGIRFTPKAILTSIGSLFLLGFAVFWTTGAAWASGRARGARRRG